VETRAERRGFSRIQDLPEDTWKIGQMSQARSDTT
jgi:hypothetical protein